MGKNSPNEPVDKMRRGCFQIFLADTLTLLDEYRGSPKMHTGDLIQVPDHIMREMMPIFNSSGSFRLENDGLVRQNGEMKDEVYHFNSDEMIILRCFDGRNTLDEIGQILEYRLELDAETAYRLVKSLFLALAKRNIVLPAQDTGC